MAFTYDITTSRGQIRFLIGDTDTATAANQIFTDAEIDWCLSSGGGVYEGAVVALTAIMSQKAILAKMIRLGNYETQERALSDIETQIKNLQAVQDGGISVASISDSAELLDTERPEWFDLEDTPTDISLP